MIIFVPRFGNRITIVIMKAYSIGGWQSNFGENTEKIKDYHYKCKKHCGLMCHQVLGVAA